MLGIVVEINAIIPNNLHSLRIFKTMLRSIKQLVKMSNTERLNQSRIGFYFHLNLDSLQILCLDKVIK